MSIDFDAVSPDVEAYPVVITIARDFGAEGHEIGKMLSLELGIPFYDNELLVRASERAGSSVSDAAAYDEQVAAELFAFLPDRMDARSSADKLFAHVVEVVHELGCQSCIIEGRLADYILRDNPNRIAVLVTAPFDARVEIVRAKRGWDAKKAKKLVKKMQRGREAFYERCGYRANIHPHVHPPYRAGFPGHELVVMSRPEKLSHAEYGEFAEYLRERVMGQ